jgi:hypothetical protein
MENRFAWLTQGNKGIIAGNQNLTIQIPTIKNYRIWSVQLKFQPLVEEGDRNTFKKKDNANQSIRYKHILLLYIIFILKT